MNEVVNVVNANNISKRFAEGRLDSCRGRGFRFGQKHLVTRAGWS
jgi:hypothetical protein